MARIVRDSLVDILVLDGAVVEDLEDVFRIRGQIRNQDSVHVSLSEIFDPRDLVQRRVLLVTEGLVVLVVVVLGVVDDGEERGLDRGVHVDEDGRGGVLRDGSVDVAGGPGRAGFLQLVLSGELRIERPPKSLRVVPDLRVVEAKAGIVHEEGDQKAPGDQLYQVQQKTGLAFSVSGSHDLTLFREVIVDIVLQQVDTEHGDDGEGGRDQIQGSADQETPREAEKYQSPQEINQILKIF